MTHSKDITKELTKTVATGNTVVAAKCLLEFSTLPSVIYESPTQREEAVCAIKSLLKTFPRDVRIVAGSLCALSHVTGYSLEVPIPVYTILEAVNHHRSNLLIVQAVARLMKGHIQKSLDGLPLILNEASRWINQYPSDENLDHWVSHIMVSAVGYEPSEIKKAHGEVGANSISISIIQATVAAQSPQLQIEGQPWNQYILNNLFSRLRERSQNV